ncbi:hypothetical protein FC756_12845 [Lysinibacillus mangiferihumi]|uniref:Uncharacterized protein n=1 Tax=Lysinibacillus mangiferihumi TaxID=1130819 RepID=A0A4U2Z2K5_9BACI|nr:hypothetical protein [Lysinibacillus mangiferihumi]TKI67552.1 hypothetical protein FC756_12845 [Lysinibacillus mangiferihumi]
MIDLKAPIVPWAGMGNIKLYSHINEFYTMIEQHGKQPKLLGKYLISFEIDNSIELWFNILNGKLFKITTLENYNGILFNKIRVGMHIDEVIKLEPSFIYDEFEEVYCSSKGVYIETDPLNNTVLWISVFIKEIDDSDFIRGEW